MIFQLILSIGMQTLFTLEIMYNLHVQVSSHQFQFCRLQKILYDNKWLGKNNLTYLAKCFPGIAVANPSGRKSILERDPKDQYF